MSDVKDPSDRVHLWERPARPDEHPDHPSQPHNVGKPPVYGEFPRTLHKVGGETKTVLDADEKAAAIRDGWQLFPGDPAA